MKKWLGAAFALGAMMVACSTETAGTSEESEGIVAISSKKIGGSVQKGPFVEGSDVVLMETSADGGLEPTGREFTTKTINDDGDFQFDSLELESQYVLLSAEGYYTREIGSERSYCILRLNAASNLEKRSTANINLLTHFEYKRVLKLVKEGKSFSEAKRQAATELMNAFGVKVPEKAAEDLNIYNSSDGDRTLYHLSAFVDQDFFYPNVDGVDEWEYEHNPANIDCSKLQEYVDSFADDLAEDGTLSDSLIAPIASDADFYFDMGNVMYGNELGLKDKDPYELMADRFYFYELVYDHYLDFETCNDSRWGESRKLDKPFEYYDEKEDRIVSVNPSYFLCNGTRWRFTKKEHLDSLKTPIPHKMGTMTDPRDNKKYKTVSFEFNGKKYEWMAEDLKYIVPSDAAGKKEYVVDGLYSWTGAMQVDYKYMFKPVKEGLIDSLHQGICPDGWHVSSAMDWVNLVAYVGGMNNLLDENWRTDEKTARAKSLYGVFTNRFDFNLVPMDKKYLDLYYHTYSHQSFVERAEAELDSLFELAEDSDELWIWHLIDGYRYELYSDNVTMEISIDYGRMTSDMRKKARVRCVKN
jgi:uncharacterized protein (TIGR02145 family)